MNVVFTTTHSLVTDHKIELPCTSWEEVEEFYVKWDTLHIKIRAQDWIEIDLDDLDPYKIEGKRADSVEVYDAETYTSLSKV